MEIKMLSPMLSRIFIFFLFLLFPPLLYAQEIISNNHFILKTDNTGITSLSCSYDTFKTDYIMETKKLGGIVIRYRTGENHWKEAVTDSLKAISTGFIKDDTGIYTCQSNFHLNLADEKYLDLTIQFLLKDRKNLLWWPDSKSNSFFDLQIFISFIITARI